MKGIVPDIAQPTDNASPKCRLVISDFAFSKAPEIDIPAMITPQERNYYHWLASSIGKDAGNIVELGVWLGASTAALSAGLDGQTIHCFDQFDWEELDNWKSGIHLSEGDDFSGIFLDNMKRVGANVRVTRANLYDFTWTDGDIDLIVIDLGKYANELAYALMVFGPRFVPGKTIIVLQDYQYFPGYQIALTIDAIRDSVNLEHIVIDPDDRKHPNAVGFRVIRPIDALKLARLAFSLSVQSLETVQSTWARISDPLPEQVKARMAPGLALYLYDASHEDDAIEAILQTPMNASMVKRWKRLAQYPYMTTRYPKLFEAVERQSL